MKLSYKQLQQKYGGKYVLMDKVDGKVVAVAKRLDKAFEQAEKKGHQYPFVQFVEPNNVIAIYEVSLRE